MSAITRTELDGIKKISSGKVRELFDHNDSLLFVATDRISAFDVILSSGIPGKGKLLTQISKFWFDKLFPITLSDGTQVNHHLIESDVEKMQLPAQSVDSLRDRTLQVKKCEIVKIEAIVRGYITGSAWSEYKKSGTVNGQAIREGMSESEKFDEPLFTPSTKADMGEHDENISVEEYKKRVPEPLASQIQEAAIKIYKLASEYAATKGIIIADTKLEFGIDSDKNLVVVDEILTPDSSRFWPVDGYTVGKSVDSFDKQFVRDWLKSVGFDKNNPVGPAIPDDIIVKTAEKYNQGYNLLTN
ncbi:phosphoribosylaminoimidazole-succinocarboxamide synthase [Wallemia mellicola]|nr:hypothetical protein E3Q24_03507 [Wallemia mellicola]TIB80749.1 phosphoribosylaminoimidazole-succinocarboxamide synthase [Wallemia mellicola]TIB84785.1 phosphoribosylaminoimidazole-succinocarboxamide synthase [Wallemia mellicola]TIC21288.1 phosphoribosylaminoimidazole-succinocarboxamide synthase [Wallemia mellicola]TIC32843.1 phosphoribosylaminoimidazole-succinocarboxamide synthase [Wallemia mellicola]